MDATLASTSSEGLSVATQYYPYCPNSTVMFVHVCVHLSLWPCPKQKQSLADLMLGGFVPAPPTQAINILIYKGSTCYF